MYIPEGEGSQTRLCQGWLLATNVLMKQIQDWPGHSDFSTTASIYAHLDYSSKLSSAQAMVEGFNFGNTMGLGK